MPERARAVAKLARDAELDHRAGQVKSAEARATVAIAAAEAMLQAMPADAGSGFLGKLLGSGQKLSDVVESAASQSHLALGGLARDRGDLATAGSEYKTALECSRRIQHGDLATGVAMLELGHTCHLQGREKEAEDWLRQAHPLLVQAQGAAYVPLDSYLLGLALSGQQRWEEAITTLEETEQAYARGNLSKGVLDARLARTDILIRTGRLDEADQVARESAEMAKQLGEPQYMAQARWHLSRIKRAQKKPQEAIGLLVEAIKLFGQAGDSWHRAQSLMVMAELQQQMGEPDDADRSLDEAAHIAGEMKSPFLEADCLRARANLRLSTGKVADARRLLTDAKRMYEDQGRDDQVHLTTALLDKLPSG